MSYKLCPKCELNYILETEQMCISCAEILSEHKIEKTSDKKVKTTPRRNIAFKCNFCDGGKNSNGIGFAGICTDSVLAYNTANKVWCSADECYCKKYMNKEIDRRQLENAYLKDNRCVCYESHLLLNWEMAAGMVVRGKNKGTPNKLLGVRTNSLCILTTQYPNESSEYRFIFGVFLVKRGDEGDDVNAGKVVADEKYRILLNANEAQKMPFWKYYRNNSDKAPQQWGTGLFRYIDDATAMKILNDIVKIKTNTQQKKQAVELLEYFRKVNSLAR